MSTEEKEPEAAAKEEEEDLEKLQAEIARMEAEAARIAQETEDLDKSSSTGAAASTAAAAEGKKSDTDTAKKDGWELMINCVDDFFLTTIFYVIYFKLTSNCHLFVHLIFYLSIALMRFLSELLLQTDVELSSICSSNI